MLIEFGSSNRLSVECSLINSGFMFSGKWSNVSIHLDPMMLTVRCCTFLVENIFNRIGPQTQLSSNLILHATNLGKCLTCAS